MSENEHGEARFGEIAEEMQALAMEGVVLAATEAARSIEEAVDDGSDYIDPFSFAIGGLFQGALRSNMPPEMVAMAIAAIAVELRPAFEATSGMPDPETAFDDLPVFDPGKES